MSGGVDSSVTAALLKERGFEVHGIHIKMWSDDSIPCQFKEDRRDALRVADVLGIPFETWDMTEEYRDAVVKYLIAEYAAGRTPNPDVMCNRKIKFGVFLARARARGADYVATGHYVKLQSERDAEREASCLLQAVDANKDQSYFLWTLTQDQLMSCMFPIGEFTKPEVRQMAKKFALPTAEKPDSQGICFIGEIDLKNFLSQHIPVRRGAIVTTSGKEVGQHDGAAFYTIGQREGLGVGGGIPYYVVGKDMASNIVRVAEGPYDKELFSRSFKAGDANWIAGREPVFPFRCWARIRYRQPLQEARVEKNPTGDLVVTFDEYQRAVTPGQSVVFYRESEMLGGACIL